MKSLELKTKKIKRICDVRNCKCTDTYAIIRGNEFTGSVFLCENCIKDIYENVFAKKETEKPTPQEKTQAEEVKTEEVKTEEVKTEKKAAKKKTAKPKKKENRKAEKRGVKNGSNRKN